MHPPSHVSSSAPSSDGNESSEDDSERVYWITEPNELGMFSVYENSLPSRNPDQEISVESIADAPSFADPLPSRSPLSVFGADAIHMMESPDPSSPSASDSNNEDFDSSDDFSFAPFLNKSVFLLMNWFYKGPRLTLNHLNRLVKNVILHPEFHKSDLQGFEAKRESQRMNDFITPSTSRPSQVPNPARPPGDGW